ncbi:hypothetical protein M23134_05170 [Microscilla marina ATCC 23134]|uniref:Uncharacterized protein n=1 Tax=Microscilla marina ATCC 23134 TaxID=313606 RepID=A1ZDC4_MICM2|nr:hypothetical protein M23134_05170 [Microscilla marina ATCC 23134]
MLATMMVMCVMWLVYMSVVIGLVTVGSVFSNSFIHNILQASF